MCPSVLSGEWGIARVERLPLPCWVLFADGVNQSMRPTNVRFYVRGYLRARGFGRAPVIIGGCERSGTTLLQSILSAHPRIHAIADELWAFCHGPPAGFRGARPIRMGRLYKYLGQYPIQPVAHRWSEKSPANIYYFDAIRRHFGGDVRLVQIVRDGRDVVSSMHPGNQFKPWVSIRRWVASMQAGLRYRNDPSVFTLRYEDLVLNHVPSVRSLCRFLDEDYTEEMSDWHVNATIRRSENLLDGTVQRLHSRSVRKFETPNFAHGALVNELLADGDARTLLEIYGYL